MKTLFLLKTTLMVSAVALLTAGCVYRERVVYRQPPPGAVVTGQEVVVTEAPPEPIVETVAVAPGPSFIWIGGAWVWRGHWVWSHGYWAHPPRHGTVWVPHRYVYRNGVHVWVRGGWR